MLFGICVCYLGENRHRILYRSWGNGHSHNLVRAPLQGASQLLGLPRAKAWAKALGYSVCHFVERRQRRISRHPARVGRAGARPYRLLLTPGPRAPYSFLNLLPF